MSNIAIIPIDNRPVCYKLPAQICISDKNNKIFLPDIDFLGSNSKNANIENILEWLERLNNIDIIIVALDTIAYGGLVSSRKSSDDFFEIKARIEKLKHILCKKNAKVYAFSSIMRISNNNFNDEEKDYWSKYGTKIFEYSYNAHKCKNAFNSSGIPSEILKDYTDTRKRNFEINKYYIELKKQGLFDTLVFSKDDCAQYGLNVKEAQELQLLSKDENGIFIKTGADEIPLALLSRALNKDHNIKIATVYTNPDTINRISKYEDISVKESVESQIELAGGVVSSYAECDIVLFINNFQNEQGELVMNVYEKGYEKDFDLPDKPYFIADILNANGADNNFVKTLMKKNFLNNFYGYAGWNTTGNTLGSAISSALTYFCAKSPDKDVFKTLQTTRFLDDWAYQANVREKIRDNNENLLNNIIEQEMQYFEQTIAEKFNWNDFSPRYTFPWQRFFEIQIHI